MSPATTRGIVRVVCSQFRRAAWSFDAVTLQTLVQERELGGEENLFVGSAIATVLAYFRAVDACIGIDGFDISIYADDEYYGSSPAGAVAASPSPVTSSRVSIPLPSDPQSLYPELSPDSATKVPWQRRFRQYEREIKDTPKTGLGSSAALITSLTASTYLFLTSRQCQLQSLRAELNRDGPGSLFNGHVESDIEQTRVEISAQDRETIHKLAQIAHCTAQGKIGSGFDVACAVYGSCLYTRFSPSLIHIPTESSITTQRTLLHDRKLIKAAVDKEWDTKIEKVALRPDVMLLMGDVKQGSSTPGMVSKVLSSKAGTSKFPEIAKLNSALAAKLIHTATDCTERREVWEEGRNVRIAMRELGEITKVPIEPSSQTSLLDATEQIQGVLGTGVPGAGGYDAIYAILDASTADKGQEVRRHVVEAWKDRGVDVLAVKEESLGLKMENDFRPVLY